MMSRPRRQMQLPPNLPKPKPHSRTEIVIFCVVVGSLTILSIVLLALTGGFSNVQH